MATRRCPKNRELVAEAVRQLDGMSSLLAVQKAARLNGESNRAAELDRQLDLAFGEKERSVGARQEHAQEHAASG